MLPIKKASLCSDGGDLGPSFNVNRLASDNEWITLPKARDPLIFIILLISFNWIRKTMAFKMKVFKNISSPGMVFKKNKNQPKPVIIKSIGFFDTKIDPPHKMQLGKTLNLTHFFFETMRLCWLRERGKPHWVFWNKWII